MFSLRVIIVLVFCFHCSFSQKKEKLPYPKSIIDIGIGSGPNYGIIGAKSIIGYKGSGLLIGAGYSGGFFKHQIGAQFTYKFIFINYCWGVYGAFGNYRDAYGFYSTSTGVYNLKEGDRALKGNIVSFGGRINLTKNKKFFLDLAIARCWGAMAKPQYHPNFPVDYLTGTAGLNYRFVYVKKKRESMDD